MTKTKTLRIVLTPEQREQIRKQTGLDVEAVELPVRELEGRAARLTLK